MGEIEKQIFDGGDAALIHSIVEEATEKATLNTLKQLELKRKEKEKNKYDRRLRNTEVLLKNYKNFKYHIENATYTDEDLKDKNLNDELDLDNKEELYINSILKTKRRTEIILKHIDNCIEYYTLKCLTSNKEDVQRRIQVIKMLYINDNEMSYFDIAKELGDVSTKTVERAKKAAIVELSALLFRNRWIKIMTKIVSKKCLLTCLMESSNM